MLLKKKTIDRYWLIWIWNSFAQLFLKMEEENKKKENAKFQVKMKVRLMVFANCLRATRCEFNDTRQIRFMFRTLLLYLSAHCKCTPYVLVRMCSCNGGSMSEIWIWVLKLLVIRHLFWLLHCMIFAFAHFFPKTLCFLRHCLLSLSLHAYSFPSKFIIYLKRAMPVSKSAWWRNC